MPNARMPQFLGAGNSNGQISPGVNAANSGGVATDIFTTCEGHDDRIYALAEVNRVAK